MGFKCLVTIKLELMMMMVMMMMNLVYMSLKCWPGMHLVVELAW